MFHFIRSVYHKTRHSDFGRDVYWTALSQVLILLTLLVINKVLSSTMSVEEFGQYNIIKRSAAVISFVMLGGMGITLPRYLAMSIEMRYLKRIVAIVVSSLGYVLVISLFIVGISELLYPCLSFYIVGTFDRTVYTIVLIYSFIQTISSYIFAYYRGSGQFRRFSTSQIIFQLLMLLPLLFIPFCNLSPAILFLSWACVGAVFLIWLTQRECREQIQRITLCFRCKLQYKTYVTALTKYSIPRLVGDFFLFSLSAFPLIYIGAKLSMTETSYYSVGVSLATMVSPIFSFLGVILLPMVSKNMARRDLAATEKTIFRLLVIYLALSVAIVLVAYGLMPYLIRFFFSEKYLVASDICRIILLSVIPSSLYYLYRNPIDAASVFPYNTIILIVSFILLVVLFHLSTDLRHFAQAYLLVATVQGALSIITWYYIKRRLRRSNSFS